MPEALYRALRPLLFRLDPEAAHTLAAGAARLGQRTAPALLRALFRREHPALRQQLFGLTFHNPVGLAAGFDKNAQLLGFWQQIGFGFAEVGSVTARPSPGNPRPRLFRLPADRALVNRMGLNNEGAAAVAARLGASTSPAAFPLGINLAKTHDPGILGDAAIDDFRESFRLLAPLAGYVALNVSCPNTREGKTFESPEALDALLTAVFAERQALGLDVPVLVKLSPPPAGQAPGGVVDDLLALSLGHGVAGFVLTNTAPDRAGLRAPAETLAQIGPGGLSGAPLAARALALTRHAYRATGGAVPLIGVGGILTAADAYARIRAGASLVQVYTGLVYRGPGLVRRLNEGLAALLERDGLPSIADAIGRDA